MTGRPTSVGVALPSALLEEVTPAVGVVRDWVVERGGGWMADFLAEPLRIALDYLWPVLNVEGCTLDLGCGSGALSRALSSAGVLTVGLDLNFPVLQAVARPDTPSTQPGAGLRPAYSCGDAHCLPFQDAQFDALISVSVLQYVDWHSVLSECNRVLRPGGRAVFIENLRGNLFARLYRGFRYWFWPYPANLRPVRHIGWHERAEFCSAFAKAEATGHHLLTPLILAMPAFNDRQIRRSMPFAVRRVFDTICQLDQWLLRLTPGIARYCWVVVVCAEKESNDAAVNR